MNIGISSACFYPIIELEKSISYMKNLGFNSGEIFINTFCELEQDFLSIINEEKQKHNFTINSVHFFSSMYEPFLFDNYKKRRDDCIKVFKKICKATNFLGGKYYTFHGMRFSDFKYINRSLILDVYKELCYIASENNIKLAQENVSWCMSKDLDFLKFLKEELKGELYYTFDIKQAYKALENPMNYLDIMGKDLVNFHINDRSDKEICLLPGKGDVNYKEIFKKLNDINYKNSIIIEVYNENFKSTKEIIESKSFLENLICF
ncbi:Sugar phosphate isomerase/epimerase [Clostridium cavendishii DSM 21758]|uniref:Sugar phosphate isomerase/epimerase n=1 Tax=Clostridium cavendishii DSM 21758 TaxID=1121302 RepID=A0A1M6EJA4_9CLOT|nr:sugar phosphate isomerase/epimerase [Clostridium cavendishii]SHI85511.1 Sugar phosphate isomerase/epimerase [Clostridium cavendishii DSM 21758]